MNIFKKIHLFIKTKVNKFLKEKRRIKKEEKEKLKRKKYQERKLIKKRLREENKRKKESKKKEQAKRKKIEQVKRKEVEQAKRKEVEEAKQKEIEQTKRKEVEEAKQKEIEQAKRKEVEEAKRKEIEETKQKETEEANQKEELVTDKTFNNIHILIVEDNKINQKIVSSILKKFEIESTIANDGQEAVDLRKENEYDLIFMDIQMPIMNGIDSTKEIISFEKDKNKNNIPIIALTSNTSDSDVAEYLSIGMKECIAKPVNAKGLNILLQKYFKENIN